MKKIIIILTAIIALWFVLKGHKIDAKTSKNYYKSINGNVFFMDRKSYSLSRKKRDMIVDNKTFKPIAQRLAIDKNYVYFKHIKKKEIDRKSFYRHNGIYKDENNVYKVDYNNIYKIEVVNPKEFHKITKNKYYEDWYTDNINYYYKFKKIDTDYSSFELIHYSYFKDKNGLYTRDDRVWLKIEGIDLNSVEIINHSFVKDNNNVYFKSKSLKNVDVNSFEIIDNYVYSKDKNNVYFKSTLLMNADPKTFKNSDSPYADYGDDKGHLYSYGSLLKNTQQ